MQPLDPQQYETLRFIHQSQREESLGHRRSIFSAFSLSMTGLLVLLAGVVAAGSLSMNMKLVIGFAVVFVGIIICVYMWQQRREAEKGFTIMRPIEERLDLYQQGSYIQGTSILPNEFSRSRNVYLGFTKGDWLHVVALMGLVIMIIVVLCLLPTIP